MPKGIHPKMAQEIIEGAIRAVAGDEGVKKAAPSINVMLEASNKLAKINGKREANFRSIKVSSYNATIRDDGHPVTVIEQVSHGPLKASGPNKTPINAGGGDHHSMCVRFQSGGFIMVICAST